MRIIQIGMLISIIIFSACSDNSQKPTFDLEGKSSLCLINNTKDTLDFRIRDNAIWPEKANYDVGRLAPGEVRVESRKSQGINDYYLSVDEKDINLYAHPGSVDTVTIVRNLNKQLVFSYQGNLEEVNDFLEMKSGHFNSYYSDRNARSNFMLDQKNALSAIYAFNDSLTQIHQEYIDIHGPEQVWWFKDFEKTRMDYLNAWYKMNAVFYRIKTLNLEGNATAEVISAPYNGLKIENDDMIGNRDYMSFLYQYISFQSEFNSEENSNNKKSRSEEIAKRLKVIDSKLTGEVKEAYMTCELSQLIDRGILYDSAWLELVTDQKYVMFLSNVKSYYADQH